MTIANYFTFMRLLISPLFLIIYLSYEQLGLTALQMPYVLLGLLLVSELTDAIDGYLARKYHQVTDLGKILDPMADSIARTTMFLTFTQPPVSLPLPLIFIFLYRDSIVSTLRTVCALRGVALAARMSGKIKAVIQGVTALMVILMMISYEQGVISLATLQYHSIWVVAIAAAYTLFSGIDYIQANRRDIARLLAFKPAREIAATSRAYLTKLYMTKLSKTRKRFKWIPGEKDA